MALSEARIFGLRQIRLYDADGLNGIDLPIAMTIRLTERIQSEEFFADGALVGAITFPVGLNWELEAGGISLPALARLTGRTLDTFGTTPNQIEGIVSDAGTAHPYFMIYGRSVGDDNTQIHVQIYKCKLTALSGEFRQTQFYTTKCSGVAVQHPIQHLYQVIHWETAPAL